MTPVYIEATTLSDAWFQTVYKCIEVGRDFTIDRGSYAGDKRLEFDYITVRIMVPWVEPLLPKIPGHYNLPDPVEDDYLYGGYKKDADGNDTDEYVEGYVNYLMTAEEKEDESYTYGNRLNQAYIDCDWVQVEYRESKLKEILVQERDIWNPLNGIIGFDAGYGEFLSQVELLIWTYKNKGYRNNQMCLQVARPDDMLLKDPPCLRHIDTRIQDGALHFLPYFRSWDLWGGFPANLAAIELMKQYVASEIGVENGEIIAASKGLHLYSYVWELAELLRGKTIQEFREGK